MRFMKNIIMGISCISLAVSHSNAEEMKGLSSEWIESLTKRGAELDGPVHGSKTKDSLKYIGMTVGGIGCGTVYLNGDGRLWVWDIFNEHHEGVVAQQPTLPENLGSKTIPERNGANYVNPPTPDTFPNSFQQGFGLEVNGIRRRFQQSDWPEVGFTGTWPVGTVHYHDPELPVNVTLKAFSPFIPLNLQDSSLPASCMEYTVKNLSNKPVSVTLSGWLENAASLKAREIRNVIQTSTRTTRDGANILLHTASEPQLSETDVRDPIVFEDFEAPDYGKWAVSGTAFGKTPAHKNQIPPYQKELNIQGDCAVNSHTTAPGETIGQKDSASGTLISPEFTINHNFIQFLIGGGDNPDIASLKLIIDGEAVFTANGKNSNHMDIDFFDVSDLQGKTAHLEIRDNGGGQWANIGVDHIVFTDRAMRDLAPFETLPDTGSMALAVLSANAQPSEQNGIPGWNVPLTLQPGEEKTVPFLISWYFPNIYPLPGFPAPKRHTAARFDNAADTVAYVAENYSRLRKDTFDWVDTWYDSTLPEWLMARTLLTANTLQTANCFIFEDGQFWAWEGIGACPGTCTHVWQYAQSLARLFPSIERNLREVTDFGYAQDPETGIVRFRGKNQGLAVDGQAGIVLRTLREHRMSSDGKFLSRVWPQCKLALQTLINMDSNRDGLLEGDQHNTLDAAWYGSVAWLSGHYLAAIRAGEEMAQVMGDTEFEQQCRTIFETGSTNLTAQLYDPQRGYFINKVDPNHLDSVNSGTGCHIDQVFGQSWAFQAGLDRILPAEETQSALRALWKNNFFTDIGPWRMENQPGRWYAVPGEAGLVMCTFPTPDWNYTKASGVREKGGWTAVYLNECMTGFEYQVASHMVYEGEPDLIRKGLAITRAIHDRYNSKKRNPYNEIECSDHYGRAAAGYGVFLAACGFEYSGPDKHIGFAPRISPENFKAPFTTAEGWGTYTQKQTGRKMEASITVNSGKLALRTITLQMPKGTIPTSAKVIVKGQTVPCAVSQKNGKVIVELKRDVVLTEEQHLTVSL